MKSPSPPDEFSIRGALQAGVAHHNAGRFTEARAVYREILDAAPDRPEALALLADILQREGADDEAIALLERAVRVAPSAAQLHRTLAGALHRRGRIDEAIAACRRAIALQPAQAAAHTDLGIVLCELGRWDEALLAFRAAVEIADLPAHRANFARVLLPAQRVPADARFGELVARALCEAWARPGDLARTAVTILLADAQLRACIDAACGAPASAASIDDAHALAALSEHRLLLALLENAQVCEARLEAFLTHARRRLMSAALAGRFAPPVLAFACALARQCFLNDYVFAQTPEEQAGASMLARRIEASLRDTGNAGAGELAVLGAYTPLATLDGAERLLEREWPECVRALLVRQIAEPRVEREDRARVPVLTPIRDCVSQGVRRQYEENPYPRWIALPACERVSFEAYLRAVLPGAPIDFSSLRSPLELLVAGCGTGQESSDLARRLADTSVLAVDLSLTSLCYARRMARSLGIANVEYAQADLLELPSLGRSFDVISSVGVLHHLADPLAGWRALAACLRPGGFMQVGLYSDLARRELAAARSFIAERGFASTPEAIRDARAALRADPRFQRVTGLRDFYGMNECRDLLFHVQEHRLTLPRIGEMAASLGLELLGFVVDPATRRRCAQRAGGGEPDFAAWDAFEREFPDTFAGMYLFWVRKPARA